LSILRRTSLALLAALALAACSEEQSKSVGQIPKKTLDKAAADVGKSMQQGQGSERLTEDRK
jgi:ABC-type glycerol-3-phosphate transport system substrate-binding protein